MALLRRKKKKNWDDDLMFEDLPKIMKDDSGGC